MNFSSEFWENFVLLIFTAIVTGFLIPYILKKVEERRLKEQKQFDADLARQNKIIDSQVQLLENLAGFLWEYQLLAIEVSYYDPVQQANLYTLAVEKYHKQIGQLLSKIRAEISKSFRLTSLETYQSLKTMYYDELLRLDMQLNALIKKQKAEEEKVDGKKLSEWYEFNKYAVYTLADIVDNTLNELARELHLKATGLQ